MTPDEFRLGPRKATVQTLLCCSIRHLPRSTLDDLQAMGFFPQDLPFMGGVTECWLDGMTPSGSPWGWFFSTAGGFAAGTDEVPSGLWPIIRYARSVGCDYVLIDHDAPTIDGLPLYDD